MKRTLPSVWAAIQAHRHDGPIRPSWTLRTTAVVAYVRARFASALRHPAPRGRQELDRAGALGGLRFPVTIAQMRIAGVPCESVVPKGKPRGTLFWFHGGAYTFGSPKSHRSLFAELAHVTGLEVLAVDYRLAPEHPAPAALEDALAVWSAWRRLHPTRPVAFGGDSAGGGLTVAAAQALADANTAMPDALVLLSPWVDLTCSFPSHVRHADADYLPTQRIAELADQVRGELSLDDRRLSPALHDSPRLPPTLIHVGTAEVLHDEGVALADRLKAAGTAVTLERWADQVHVWHAFSPLLPSASEAIARVGQWTTTQLKVPATSRP